MVRILKPSKKVRVERGVVIYVKTDRTVEAVLVETPTMIDTSGYVCVILITEEVKHGN